MPKQRIDKKTSRRQDPVSCSLCRSRKLKCNRQYPSCSNCTERGVTCEWPSTALQRNIQSSVGLENAAILARLNRLEQVIAGINSNALPSPSNSDFSELPKSVVVPPVPTVTSENERAQQLESRRLEIIGSTDASDTGFGQDLVIGIRSNQELLETPSEPTRSVYLPPKKTILPMIDYYAEYITHLHHVIHLPSLRQSVADTYSQLNQGKRVEPGKVALILNVITMTAYMSTYQDNEKLGFTNEEQKNELIALWAKAGLDLLENSRRTGSSTFDYLQATALASFLTYNIDGYTARFRSLFSYALSIAKDLGMHKLDCHQDAETSESEKVDKEVKRRLWWYIVATDWNVSLAGGPQEGTYAISPKHMKVSIPRNLNDEDIGKVDQNYQRPLSEPTIMSYPLQRIRLGEVCRQITDTMPSVATTIEELNYEEIIRLDRLFDDYFNGLPIFLRIDEASVCASQEAYRKYPHLAIQRFTVELIANTRRCKFHQPFLIRGSLGGPYAFSREKCLQSARKVIAAKKRLEGEGLPFGTLNKRHCSIIHHVFMATTVLVMDLCFNKIEGMEAERKAEVARACAMLEESSSQSIMAAKYLNSLMDILRKHKIRVMNEGLTYGDMANPRYLLSTSEPVYKSSEALLSMNMLDDMATSTQINSNTMEPLDFDQLWQSYVEMGPSFDVPDWDQIFSELDSGLN